jgi:hypothetical protein
MLVHLLASVCSSFELLFNYVFLHNFTIFTNCFKVLCKLVDIMFGLYDYSFKYLGFLAWEKAHSSFERNYLA